MIKQLILNTIGKIFTKKIIETPTSVSPEILEKRLDKTHGLTKKSYDLIIKHETGGESYYKKALQRPTYPGGQSGVTIGIGYDLGYNTAEGFARDWKNKLDAKVFARLHGCIGLKGKAASAKISGLKDINIPWSSAQEVFNERTLPRFIKLTKTSFPGADKLHPDAFGALVSIVFNRGGSTKGASRVEMKNIKDAIATKPINKELYKYIADQIVAMKRLWTGKGLDGLLRRRDEEADIIRKCI
jgi:hypothetical protein